MQKTPVAARFLQRLVAAGDLICFSAFRQWEFDRTLASLASRRPNEFTPAVFTANPLSKKINRRMVELPSFSSDAEQIALRMSVIASVEHVLAYLDEVQTFRALLSPTEADQLTHDAEEEQLRLKSRLGPALASQELLLHHRSAPRAAQPLCPPERGTSSSSESLRVCTGHTAESVLGQNTLRPPRARLQDNSDGPAHV